MPRIEPKTRDDLPEHLKPLWDKMLGYGDFADQAGAMAHRMPVFEKELVNFKDHPELDDVDKLVVEYAIAVTTKWNQTRDEIFTRLREHFSESQLIELTWRIALCGAFNRFNDILQLESHE
jgi:hypothetical protein